jgi:type IV pilus assembly protein PilE
MKRGFTLIEILTVVVVLGVLAAVAIPSWRQHVLRTRRADAKESLIRLQVAQEDFFGRHARYATTDEMSLPTPAGLGMSANSGDANYRIEIRTAPDGLAFDATARAAAAQSDDTFCATFTINHLGMRGATDATGADRSLDCWR